MSHSFLVALDSYPNILTTLDVRDAIREAEKGPNNSIKPVRLTFIKLGACQFCPGDQQSDGFYPFYISIINKFGFYTCSNCTHKGKKYVENYLEESGYNSINKFINQNIQGLDKKQNLITNVRLNKWDQTVYKNKYVSVIDNQDNFYYLSIDSILNMN